jgi:sugar/nucleoside kinase (ribokinase family)
MDLWIDIAREALLDVIGRVTCVILNDAELRQLTERPNVISAAHEVLSWGPSVVVAKKGEHGATLVTDDSFFALPAYPLRAVVDPTGAGDTFAGGFVGYLAHRLDRSVNSHVLRNAMAYGPALASFNVEAFGTEGVIDLDVEAVRARVEDLQELTRFDHDAVDLDPGRIAV